MELDDNLPKISFITASSPNKYVLPLDSAPTTFLLSVNFLKSFQLDTLVFATKKL